MKRSVLSGLALVGSLTLAVVAFRHAPVASGASNAGATVVATPCADRGAWRMVMDDANIYWTDFDGGKVMKAPLSGGPATVLATGQPGPCGIAVDSTTVY
ncbi:MAG TPA: hypothetical protein VIZ68_04090, partial [Thermoplasmata archaeon]